MNIIYYNIYSVPGKLKAFIDDLHSGKLHRQFHGAPEVIYTVIANLHDKYDIIYFSLNTSMNNHVILVILKNRFNLLLKINQLEEINLQKVHSKNYNLLNHVTHYYIMMNCRNMYINHLSIIINFDKLITTPTINNGEL